MILTNRLFTRREPERDARSMFIFCEGKKREAQYFRYFQGIDSRINIVVHPMKGDEDNSPTGLYRLAAQHLIKTENNPYPTYELLKEDEVWFVVDTDSWGNKVAELSLNERLNLESAQIGDFGNELDAFCPASSRKISIKTCQDGHLLQFTAC